MRKSCVSWCAGKTKMLDYWKISIYISIHLRKVSKCSTWGSKKYFWRRQKLARSSKVYIHLSRLDKNFISIIFSADLYIGNTIVLYSRTLKILDYGDDFTRNNCSVWSESTFALLKPSGIHQCGLILSQIQDNGFKLARAKMVHLKQHQAEYFYRKYQTQPYFCDIGNYANICL